jgi:integrase
MDTQFKSDLIDKLKSRGLTDSSIKLYVRNLEKLNDDMPLKNLKFLDNVDNIVEKLKDYKDNTKRGYLISITAVLNTVKDDSKKAKKLYETYYNKMIEKAKEIKSKPTEEMNESQKENWVSWDKVKEKFDALKSKVESFINNKEINEMQYNILLSYVVLSLYVYNPPRRNKDYQLMNIVKDFSDVLPIDVNYLSYDENEFIFNVFKTSKKEGQVKIKFNEDMKKVITQYLKFHPLVKGKKLAKTSNLPFLVYFDSKPFTSVNSITRILNKLFDGNVGSSMLRHIFLTDKYGNTLKEQEKDAKAMGHSVSTQKDYIKDDKNMEI